MTRPDLLLYTKTWVNFSSMMSNERSHNVWILWGPYFIKFCKCMKEPVDLLVVFSIWPGGGYICYAHFENSSICTVVICVLFATTIKIFIKIKIDWKFCTLQLNLQLFCFLFGWSFKDPGLYLLNPQYPVFSYCLGQGFPPFWSPGTHKLITKILWHTKTIFLPIWQKIGIIFIHSHLMAVVVLAVVVFY